MSQQPRFRPQPRPLADLVDGCIGGVLAAQGFTASDIVVSWADIVGDRLALYCRPVKVEWPRGAGRSDDRREPATLVVRVESAFALELQHVAPLVIDRVNAHYGWRCIGRIVMKQGPVPRPVPRRRELPPLDPVKGAKVAEAVAVIDDEGLRSALDRLGRAISATKA
jgi:hypothetical protein